MSISSCLLLSIMMRALIIVLALTIPGCADHKYTTMPRDLTGVWANVDDPDETLSFEYLGEMNIMILKRSVLLRTGAYQYKILPDGKINVHWLLSASTATHDYPFVFSGKEFTIGNFYEASSGTILTFRRLQ